MADVAQMELLEPEAIDFDNYKDGGGGTSYAPPPEGRYFVRVPVFPKTDDPDVFQKTQEGYLKVKVDPLEVTQGDYKIRFTSLSAKKYSNREGNQIIDFIRACGLDLRPKTNEEYKNAVRQCSARTAQIGLIWEAYNKDSQESLKGMENFPTGADGKPQAWIENSMDPGKKVYANGKVRYWVSALSK